MVMGNMKIISDVAVIIITMLLDLPSQYVIYDELGSI